MRRFVRGMRLTVINPSNFVGSLQFTSDLPPMTLTISSQGNSYFIFFFLLKSCKDGKFFVPLPKISKYRHTSYFEYIKRRLEEYVQIYRK